MKCDFYIDIITKDNKKIKSYQSGSFYFMKYNYKSLSFSELWYGTPIDLNFVSVYEGGV